ncbi:type II secretion system protein [Kocuria coralli]|uniref:Type II secretion system protein n=1 Tax=Kocuria coralli TaxID=1461025 RepID=A0A5J5L103_9MICC|nr:type II secretion system F family protein [Kocuria coralli]KAA9395310.1 type II secretion system protein [Kocuria coralli]
MNPLSVFITAALLALFLAAGLAVAWLPAHRSRALFALSAIGPVAAAPAGNVARGHEAREREDRAEPPASAAVLVELVVSMLEAGMPVDRSLTVLGQSLGGPSGRALRAVGTGLGLGLPWRQAWASAGDIPVAVQDLRAALTFSSVSGAPSAAALRATSAHVRRLEHRRAEAAAERLAVHLVVPLGLCSLPAFIAWGIVPVLIGLVPELFR